jgi:very-short-patch-repair endonuclease
MTRPRHARRVDVLRALDGVGEPIATRAQLLRVGVNPRELAAAVHADRVLRVRRGYYCRPSTDPALVQAVRIGGRLGCVSAAQSLGIWSTVPTAPHVAMRHEASRLRSPGDRFTALTTENRDGCELHWWSLPERPARNIHTVSAIEALAHVVHCQPRELAIASIDSALYQLAVTPADVHGMFERLPRRYRRLESLVDGRCMSGIESLVRLLLLDAGIPFELQVSFRGVGTVDFIVAGRVVVEIDGRLGHAEEPSRARDYRRDAAVIRLGYAVVRLDYAQVMFDPAGALATIVAAIASHRGTIGQR